MTARRAAAAITLVGLLASGLAAAPAAPAAAATDPVGLTVAPRNAGVLQSGRPLDVDVVVRNTGSSALPAGTLAFSLDQAPAASTAELLTGEASIANPSPVLLGRLTLTKATTPALAPGTSAQVRARISADDIDSILTRASGARRLFVRLRAQGVQQVAESAVVRMASDAPRVAFGTVIPLTAPAGTTGVVDVDAQAALTADDGAWSQALGAARAMPSAVVALDPEVIASIRLAGVDAPESAQQLLADLADLPNPVLPLPYADGDVALQRAAGLTGSTSPSSFAGVTTAPAPTSTASPAPSATSGAASASPAPASDLTDWDWSGDPLLWPVPGTATNSLIAGHATSGPVLLSASELQDSTARMAAGPLASVDRARVLVADTAASRLLAASTVDGVDGAAALAPLVAALATDAVTGSTPSVLAVAGRGASGAGLARVLDRLGSQRWIRGDTLASMTGRQAVGVALRAGAGAPSGLAQATALVESERTVQRLATAVQDPPLLAGPQRLALLGLLSAQWRNDDGWAAAAASGVTAFDDVAGRVSIVEAGQTTVGGSDGSIRVSVQNRLSQAVTVRIRATTNNARLRFQDTDPQPLRVPPNSFAGLNLQVDTIANGPAQVTLGLTTPDGAPIGVQTSRDVTVYSGFDTIVAVVLLTLLGALLALGVYRNIARRRRPKAER